jgi:hypothetical protein
VLKPTINTQIQRSLPSEQRVTVYQQTKKTQNVRLDCSLSRRGFHLGFKEMKSPRKGFWTEKGGRKQK